MVKKKRKKRIKKKKRSSWRLYFRELFIACIGGMLLMIILCSFFFRVMKVSGFAMLPVLRDQDVVVVRKTKSVKRFDLIALDRGTKRQIRRVIGLPGETIQYNNDTLFVDGEPVDEKFLVDEINESQQHGRDFTTDFINGDVNRFEIPEGYYLVLGDNRPYATDSRHYGLLAERNIIGRVQMKVFPINDICSF